MPYIKQSTRKITVSVLILGVAVFLALYFFNQIQQQQFLEDTQHQLMQNPRPIPPYILDIAPAPGSEYPTDADNDYRRRIDPDEIVCVSLDANVLNPQLAVQKNLHPFDAVAGKRIDLYLNNEPYDKVNEWQAENEKDLAPLTLYTFYPEGGRITPVDFCWKLRIPPGLYLAEVVVHSEISGTLRYQWAFEVVED